MKTEVKKIDSVKREIKVEVSGEVVKNKFEDVFKRIAKEAKAPGFRMGHVPRDILEKNYSQVVHEQVLKELIPDVYHEAITKEGLDAIDLPEISEVKLDRNALSFRAAVEISPEIALKNYKGLKITYKRARVEADELKRNIDSLKESRQASVVDDAFAKGLGYPAVSDLEKAIELQVFLHKEEMERRRVENEIIETLTKDLDFKLPPSLVKRQLEELLRHAKVDLSMKGYPKEKLEEQEKEMIKNLEPEAQKQVKIYLVLAQIAKKENIPISDAMPRKVMEFLLKEADWNIAEPSQAK